MVPKGTKDAFVWCLDAAYYASQIRVSGVGKKKRSFLSLIMIDFGFPSVQLTLTKKTAETFFSFENHFSINAIKLNTSGLDIGYN